MLIHNLIQNKILKKEFEQSYPAQVDKVALRSLFSYHIDENPSTGSGQPYELLIWDLQDPKTTQNTAPTLGSPSEITGDTTWRTQSKHDKTELQAPACCLAFTMRAGIM